MPLSPARNRERMKLAMRVKRAMLQPNFQPGPNCLDSPYRDADGNVATYVKPKSLIVKPNIVQPKLPFYAGAGDHFGEVKSHYYAEQFFSNLFQGVS